MRISLQKSHDAHHELLLTSISINLSFSNTIKHLCQQHLRRQQPRPHSNRTRPPRPSPRTTRPSSGNPTRQCQAPASFRRAPASTASRASTPSGTSAASWPSASSRTSSVPSLSHATASNTSSADRSGVLNFALRDEDVVFLYTVPAKYPILIKYYLILSNFN